MSILWCIAIAVLGVMIMVIADMDVDYSTLFASVLVLYYLFIYTKTAKADTLTGLLNRQCYYADAQKERDRITCVVSVDMNDLKKINDSQGHEAGDLALMTVSKCLSKGMGRKKHAETTVQNRLCMRIWIPDGGGRYGVVRGDAGSRSQNVFEQIGTKGHRSPTICKIDRRLSV